MLYIRTDMNEQIATGHLMRCLSVADAVRQCGGEVTFILADGQAVPMLESRRYPAIVLGTDWRDLEGELSALLAVIPDGVDDVLLVDHYSVTERYLAQLREHITVAYIDDLNAFHYPVDLLICYANYYEKFGYAQRYRGRTPKTELLLGTDYVPLRSAFHNCGVKDIRADVRSLLLLSGGADPYGVIRSLLEELTLSSYERIYAICGMYNPDYELLAEKYRQHPNVRILQSVPDLDRYMREADMAVSAAGSTLYELCAVGTPAISYTMADNQLDNARKFREDRLIPYAGDMRDGGTIGEIVRLLENCCPSRDARQDISRRMQAYVDGNGAARIARRLLAPRGQD